MRFLTIHLQISDQYLIALKLKGNIQAEPQTYRAIKRVEKVYGKIQDGEPVVPQRAHNVHQGIETVRHSLPIFEKRNLVMQCINLNQVE